VGGSTQISKNFFDLTIIKNGVVGRVSVPISANLWLINLGWKGDLNPENLRASASHSGGGWVSCFSCV